MGSTSNLPANFEDDDDDEIDWSEACREIDIVCGGSRSFASTSSIPSEKPHRFFPAFGNAKQSTLDNFVVKSVPRIPLEIRAQSEEKPSCVDIDPEAAKTWIYPVNISMREYQFNITKTSLFSNTLVALPTGLGKTFIAAVVMYNYFRWFPDGKIVFAAPSRPLVLQQIEACHNIVGIPQEMTIDMTGLTIPAKRADLWKSKRVFFVTPQVLEKDLQSGICFPKHLVCLVIDEAHRALGNYASSVAVRELMGVPVCLRILALTATPGSKKQAIQQVIDNLRISTLEYREESDHDVIKYVHDRKLELIQVAVGQNAIEINKKLSLVINPFLKKLYDWRIHPHKDERVLSPTELLTSRERFRQARENISNFDKNDAEGYFGLLISLVHIRRLLLVHGIAAAHEMLQDKLKQGSFARYMSRNEGILKAKFIMEQSFSTGAPSPKLSTMLQVLLDHFRKDPENSKVIIFSNFRQSVSEIIRALAKLGSGVRATEFVGQSSGKNTKGQSQKLQQAVLEKFRAGEYNVIVATSIGEEGLDIVEVDLVICFDANVSPLRMIQRMGRTGRKNDGRVVVLACEGMEMKSYTQKLASSKSIGNHMRNGGVNSFTFHPSPRMVPHIYKPKVEYVEIAIEKFVHSGKNVKNDVTSMTPVLQGKLTDSERNLISKYFYPPEEGLTWKPSLIAFPHFQAVSSRVYNVSHSYKTGLLIDAMQQLQGHSFSSGIRTTPIEDGEDLWVDDVEHHANSEGFLHSDDSPMLNLEGDLLECEGPSPDQTVQTKDQSPAHSYLYGSDFVSVDHLGNVVILSVPVLRLKELSSSKNTREHKLLNFADQFSWHLEKVEDNSGQTMQSRAVQDQKTPQKKCRKYGSYLCSSGVVKDKTTYGPERVPVTLTKIENSEYEDSACETPDDIKLSPRLTNMIKSGVVPESPIGKNGLSNGNERNLADNDIKRASETPVLCNNGSASIRGCTSVSPMADKSENPLVDLTNDSNSKDWQLSIEEISASVKNTRKFKRLRKIGDFEENENLQRERGTSHAPRAKHSRRRKKQPVNEKVRVFIDEEAEVSSDGDMSEDEEDYQDNNSPNSFIDDTTCSTNPVTQSATAPDMMAIYRRSLFTQSPMPRHPSSSTTTPTSCSSSVATARTSDTQSFSFHSPHTNTKQCVQMNCDSETVPCTTGDYSINDGRKSKLSFSPSISLPPVNLEREFQLLQYDKGCDDDDDDDAFFDDLDCDAVEAHATLYLQQKTATLTPQKKKEISFPLIPQSPGFDEATLLLQQKSVTSTTQKKQEISAQTQSPGLEIPSFEGIDLDAIEAEAILHLQQKSQKKQEISAPSIPRSPASDMPSFDLGID